MVFHLKVEHHLVESNDLLVERKLNKEETVTNQEELVLLYAVGKAAVDTVFTSHPNELRFYRGSLAVKVDAKAVETVENVGFFVGEAWILVMGSADDAFKTGIVHYLHTSKGFFITLGAIIHSRQEMTMNVDAKGFESGNGFFWFGRGYCYCS